MKEQTTNSSIQHPREVDESFTLDLKRAAMMAAIAREFIAMVLSYPKLPEGMNRQIIRDASYHLSRFEREVLRASNRKKIPNLYLDKAIHQSKLFDIANLIDATARIGAEEGQSVYEEFMGLIVDTISAVFYSQKHRSKIRFSKYKALFKFITEEVKGDVNGDKPRLLYQDGELYIRASHLVNKPDIK